MLKRNLFTIIFCLVMAGNMHAQVKLDVEGELRISTANIPMGLTNEVNGDSPILNMDVNFRQLDKSIMFRGAAFRIDTRDAYPLFQWFKRGAGTTQESLLMALAEDGDLRLLAMDTITTAQDTTAGNVVRLSDGTLALRQYKIGDMAQGGIVFWVDETGEHGLVSSLSDIESTTADFSHQWSSALDNTITAATGDGIGAGAMNTMLMVSTQRGDEEAAARLCADLMVGGYGDWYLPSKHELYLMYKNLHRNGCSAASPGGTDNSTCTTSLGNFAASFYWSSSEFDGSLAWAQFFDDGLQLTTNKNFVNRVRAIRAF